MYNHSSQMIKLQILYIIEHICPGVLPYLINFLEKFR